jgi:peptidoglycan biosynthesis protein MviN/MurJ (putative lipid II flippase)
MMPVIFRLFFSMRDTATPTLTTVVSVFANIVLNYWLVAALAAGPLARMIRSIFDLGGVADIGVLGLSLAYSLANALQFVMLLILLYRKDAAVMRASEIIGSLAKTVLAGIFMAVAVYFVSAAMPVAGTLPALAAIAAASTAGMAVYGTITLLTGSAEALAVKQAIANKWNRTNRKSGTL